MTGNQAPDIDHLIKILSIIVIATVILVAVLGAIFVVKMFTDDEAASGMSEALSTSATPLPDEPDPVITPIKTPQTSGIDSGEYENLSGRTIRMPVDASAEDSVKVVESIIPDDPAFKSEEFNNTAADYTLAIEYYQLLYQKEYTFLYNSSSIIATVGKGPLVVCYDVSNFAVTSGSGTGSTMNTQDQYTDESSTTIEGLPYENPYYSFLDIAVTDTSTGEVVATGGFGRTHPSTEEQYLKIPLTGEYRIDMYGSGLDLELRILSGTVPENPNAIAIDPNMKNKYSIVISEDETGETGASSEPPMEMWY
ncbi:MAG: hypothetical protein JW931_05960 [Methanomicrobiaceae archaeon]|nr:hypothetical protein [Methanomicrobiaceae archaeon]